MGKRRVQVPVLREDFGILWYYWEGALGLMFFLSSSKSMHGTFRLKHTLCVCVWSILEKVLWWAVVETKDLIYGTTQYTKSIPKVSVEVLSTPLWIKAYRARRVTLITNVGILKMISSYIWRKSTSQEHKQDIVCDQCGFTLPLIQHTTDHHWNKGNMGNEPSAKGTTINALSTKTVLVRCWDTPTDSVSWNLTKQTRDVTGRGDSLQKINKNICIDRFSGLASQIPKCCY